MQKQIKSDGVTLFYEVVGSGKPVLLIHGFAEDSDVWKHQVDFLKDSFQLIIPDLPGSGLSQVEDWEKFTGGQLLSIDRLADCIQSILEQEKIRHCSMIGHSMGGYITLAFAEKYPGVLNSLGLFHSTAYADTEEKIQTRRRGIEFIHEYGARAFLKQSIPNLFGSKYSNENPGAISALIERGNSFTPGALVQYYEAMIARPNRVSVLKNFNGPVLFIIGTEDKAVSYTDSLQQAHLPNISYVHILNGTAHMGMWEQTEKSNGFLKEFLSA